MIAASAGPDTTGQAYAPQANGTPSVAASGVLNTGQPSTGLSQNVLPLGSLPSVPTAAVTAANSQTGVGTRTPGAQVQMAWALHSTPISAQIAAGQQITPHPPLPLGNVISSTATHQVQNQLPQQNTAQAAAPPQGLQQQPQFNPPFRAQQRGHPTRAAFTAPLSRSTATPAAQLRTRTGPCGDADDTDDEEMTFSHRGSDASGGNGRNRGRGRNRTRASHERSRSLAPNQGLDQARHSDSEEDDPNDGYADNRETLEFRCRNLTGIKEFDSTDKNGNFNIFITKFEDAVNRCHNPHSKRRHHKYCLKWLPSFLSTDAFTVWRRSLHRKTNWEELKKELRKEFEDPIIRSEWKSNLKAYTWDKAMETLHSYCSKVKGYVDTFEPDLEEGSRAKLDAYYTRFVSGLPDDYQKQIKLNVPTNKQTISRAYDISLRYQAALNG